MEGSFLFAFQRHFLRTNRVHEITVIDITCEKTQGETGAAQDGIAGHEHDIHLTVLYTGLGRYDGFVTPLVRIGEGDKKSFVGDINAVSYDMVGLGVIGENILHNAPQIGGEPAFLTTRKLIRYHRIKTRATRAHEQASVCQTVVHIDRLAVINHLNRFLRTNRNIQMTSKTVSATHRQDTQGGVGVFQPPCHFVHRAIAAYGHYGIKAHARVLMRQICGMTCVLRENDIRQPLLHIQRLHDQLR